MVNKVILVGNVGGDPDIKYLDGGIAVARLSLATTERYRKNEETIEQTEWHSIVLWRGLAEIVEKYVSKGMKLYIEGRLRTRQWEKDGVKHYSTEIYADSMQMLTSKSETSSKQSTHPKVNNTATTPITQPVNEESDDLPF